MNTDSGVMTQPAKAKRNKGIKRLKAVQAKATLQALYSTVGTVPV